MGGWRGGEGSEGDRKVGGVEWDIQGFHQIVQLSFLDTRTYIYVCILRIMLAGGKNVIYLVCMYC